MRKLTLLLMTALISVMVSCSKSDSDASSTPRTDVPEELTGNWMFGYFSMIDYWSQDPAEYLGPGVEMAFAFTFNADGTFTEYFTAGAVMNGIQTYQQSVSKGTVEVDPVSKTIKTHTSHVHYRRTVGGQVAEDRDMRKEEYDPNDSYTYTTGVEPGGTDALYLTLEGTTEPLTFLRK